MLLPAYMTRMTIPARVCPSTSAPEIETRVNPHAAGQEVVDHRRN
jgi:hypothetical protein